MKKVLSTVITASLVMGMMAPTAFGASQSFVDIEKSYAKDAIVELQSMGILNGMDDTHFNPKGTLTRAQFVAIIVRTLGLDAPEVASSFTDVKGWATAVIEAASKAGIIDGVGNGKFAPNGLLTREAAATILVRALQLKGEVTEGGELTFTDANKISAWAKPFIAVAQHYGLIKGNPDGTFNPKGSANREMAAMMGMNLLGAFDEVKAPDTTTPVTPVDPKPDDTTTPPATGGGGGGGGGGWYSPTYYVQSITVAAAADSIATKGGTLQMTASILPTYATNANVTWSVSNDNATISSAGLLTAVKDGTVTVKATAVDGSAVAGTKVITISSQTTTTPPVEDADTTAPVITLNGDSVVDLVYGAEYVDAGATATDNKDGDIAVVVTISNEAGEATTAIDTTVAGAYTYHYNVSDAAGNAAVEVTRSVTVAAEVVIPPVEEDTTAPVIALVGDPVVDVVYGATYVDAGATASDNKDGNLSDSIHVTITNDASEVIQAVTTTVYGAYTYHYNVSDAAGNEAEEVTRTVNVAAEVDQPAAINDATLTVDNGLILNFSVTESVYLGLEANANIEISYFTKNRDGSLSAISNSRSGTSLVKDKTWDGYLWGVDSQTNYSQGTAGTTAYENLIPTGTKLASLVRQGYHENHDMDYVAIDWTASATYVVDIKVTDDAGNVTTETVEASVVNPSDYVTMQDFSKSAPDVTYAVYGAYNLGFKINLDNLDYSEIATVTGTVYDGDTVVGKVSANTQARIDKYEASDIQYGERDGQLSFDFVGADALDDAGVQMDSNGVYQSSYLEYTVPVSDEYMYGVKLPTSAILEIVTKQGLTIRVQYVYA